MAARLAERAGRVTADGFVTVALPVNERADGDTRANAITAVDITVDPAAAATDLREIRAAIKQALIRRQEVPDERWALLPLTPLLPRWLIRGMAGVALGGATTSGSSNLGALNPAANRPDGTDADYFAMRTFYPGVTKATLHRTGGLLGLLSGRVHGQVFISVLGYQPGRPNTIDDLWRDLSSALSDFSLTATTGWGCTSAGGCGPINASVGVPTPPRPLCGDVAGEHNAQNRGNRSFRRLSLTSATQRKRRRNFGLIEQPTHSHDLQRVSNHAGAHSNSRTTVRNSPC